MANSMADPWLTELISLELFSLFYLLAFLNG